MAFLMGVVFFVMFFPMIAAFGAFVFLIFGVIGCLVAIGGVTGLLMNYLYERKTGDQKYKPVKKAWGIAMVVYGIVFMILPFVFIAAGLLSINL